MDILSKEDDLDITTLLQDIREEIGDVGVTKVEISEIKKDPSVEILDQYKSNKIISDESENTKNYNFLNICESKKIKHDIEQMRLELKKSQDFFSSARDSLESINFENIKLRLKNLPLYPSAREVNEIFEDLEGNKELNIAKLTKTMSDKFKDHPGEFADIPEVSSFFKLCTQLQKGLDDLDKKKKDFDVLGKRIVWATDVSENRSKEIQKVLSDQNK